MFPLTDEIASALRPAIPEMDRDTEPELVDVGFSSIVVRFGGTVARVARNEETAEGHRREARTVEVLRDRLPVAIPFPFTVISPTSGVPFGATLHPWVPGRVMTASDAATYRSLPTQIAELLLSLHTVRADAFPPETLLTMDPLPYLRRVVGETDPILRIRLSSSRRESLATMVVECERVLPGRPAVVCHGDAWFGNMLVDDAGDGALTGLLDFQDACIADPALDLAAQTYLDAPTNEETVAAYVEHAGPLPALTDRIRCYLLIREIGGLAYSLRNDLPDEVEHILADVIGALDAY